MGLQGRQTGALGEPAAQRLNRGGTGRDLGELVGHRSAGERVRRHCQGLDLARRLGIDAQARHQILELAQARRQLLQEALAQQRQLGAAACGTLSHVCPRAST